ncbi:hypothetical protein [Bacillus sp. MRMR6]|uniref:hypothetical protein n=1 Tax=Bacillus sp. MRMR6 TaxID=1928617 RepID=UPI000951A867|nr:hypothetical protein [Bacillus sp. MRMR6]OLS33687.1 hypothetical protein BTR25_24690 [Bacillus sp. MRMR6]
MGFVVFFFLAWLVVSSFVVIRKRLSIVENTVIFLVILIVSINFSWIMMEEFEFIKPTKVGIDYTAFLLNRSVITPLIMVILLNLFPWGKSVISKGLLVVYAVIVMLCLSNLSIFLKITKFSNWNYGYEAVYYFLLAVIAVATSKIFRRFSRNGERAT